MKKKYDKKIIEDQALISSKQGFMTDVLGHFVMQRAKEISHYSFVTNNNEELRQSLVDEAVMRVCEKFLHYYVPGKSAANLIISIIYSTMNNKIVSLKWRDVYGQKIKGNLYVIEDGEVKLKLVRYIRDDYTSKKL